MEYGKKTSPIMNEFSISDLEAFTGIKAHTIRIWESRYHLLTPSRSAGNIRTYSDQDLKTILNVSFLLNHGSWRISAIAAMSEEERQLKVIELAKNEDEEGLAIQELTIAMLTFNEHQFNVEFSNCVVKWGFDTTITKIIGGFLHHIGILWQTSAICPAHEHFISNLIRQKLYAASDSYPVPDSSKVWLLFLPQSEMHELGLLYMNFLLRLEGYHTVYLGQSVPLEDLEHIARALSVKGVISFFTTHPIVEDILPFVERMQSIFNNSSSPVQYFIGGFQVSKAELKSNGNVHYVSDLAEMRSTFMQYQTEYNTL